MRNIYGKVARPRKPEKVINSHVLYADLAKIVHLEHREEEARVLLRLLGIAVASYDSSVHRYARNGNANEYGKQVKAYLAQEGLLKDEGRYREFLRDAIAHGAPHAWALWHRRRPEPVRYGTPGADHLRQKN